MKFSPLSPLPAAPGSVIACGLDGDRVLAIAQSIADPARAFVWTSGDRAWTSVAPPPPGIGSLIGLAGRRALGLRGEPTVSPSCVPIVYDHGADAWTEGEAWPIGRHFSENVVLADHTVVLIGGRAERPSRRVDRYDPGAGTWRRSVDLPLARVGHRAIALDDGRVLVAGGVGERDWASEGNRRTFVHDPRRDTWLDAGELREARTSPVIVRLGDGRVAVLGGTVALRVLRSIEIFDPVASTWTWGKVLTTGRLAPAATLLPDGRVLVSGGLERAGRDESSVRLATTEIWDPRTGASEPGPTMHAARHNHAVIPLAGARWLFVGGGFTGPDQLAAELLEESDAR